MRGVIESEMTFLILKIFIHDLRKLEGMVGYYFFLYKVLDSNFVNVIDLHWESCTFQWLYPAQTGLRKKIQSFDIGMWIDKKKC